MQRIKNHLRSHYINAFGWRTKRKIIVIESDDWGSIRMPSREVFNKLKYKIKLSLNDSLDALEKKEDLDSLLNVLKGYYDIDGKNPVFTCNMVMGNPDFKKIKDCQFTNYYLQDLYESYRFYYNQNLENIWDKGISERLIYPQFHAKEHLNIHLWMEDLRMGNSDTLIAFDHYLFSHKTTTSSPLQKHYLAAYFAEDNESLQSIQEVLSSGLDLFDETFGFPSKSFIACNYIWPKELEKTLNERGVKFLQGRSKHLFPVLNKSMLKGERHYTGEKNENKQIYLVRNAVFEPHSDQNIDWVNKVINEIDTSFKWWKPAIISTHRANYVSHLSISNRDLSLKKLDQLLYRVIEKWPEVEFMTSDQLGEEIAKSSQ